MSKFCYTLSVFDVSFRPSSIVNSNPFSLFILESNRPILYSTLSIKQPTPFQITQTQSFISPTQFPSVSANHQMTQPNFSLKSNSNPPSLFSPSNPIKQSSSIKKESVIFFFATHKIQWMHGFTWTTIGRQSYTHRLLSTRERRSNVSMSGDASIF